MNMRSIGQPGKTGNGVRLSEHLDGAEGEMVFHHACRLGLEGIVAKRRDRPYRSGRCADWIKVKNRAHPSFARAELIVWASGGRNGADERKAPAAQVPRDHSRCGYG